MPRKLKEIKIESVEFYYIGTGKDFDLFLKSVIKNYLDAQEKDPQIVGNAENITA